MLTHAVRGRMATSAVHPGEQAEHESSFDVQAAAFHALEQRVLRAIELLRKERELRSATEQQLHQAEEHGLEMELRVEEQTAQLAEKATEIGSLTSRLNDQVEQTRRMEGELSQLNGERDQVRQRVEKLLQHLDEFTGV